MERSRWGLRTRVGHASQGAAWGHRWARHSHTAEILTWEQPGFRSGLCALSHTGSVWGPGTQPACDEHPESVMAVVGC